MFFGEVLAAAIAAHQAVETKPGFRLDGGICAGQAVAFGRVDQRTVELEIEIAPRCGVPAFESTVHTLCDFRQGIGNNALPSLRTDFPDGCRLERFPDEKHIQKIVLVHFGDEHSPVRCAAQ